MEIVRIADNSDFIKKVILSIDPDIEKQISLLQEEKLNSKIKEDIKKVVKVVEQPTEKLLDFFSVIAKEKKQTQENNKEHRKHIVGNLAAQRLITHLLPGY